MTRNAPPRIRRLTSVGAVAGELAHVYRMARRGELDVADASRLANILSLLRQALEVGRIEERLDQLEDKVS
ncbi:MAG: hypothetical protein ACRC67_09495 [Inquilinus sp.]|uniref:hypothetical protein n=1 Tax=Inquilinus sp. TaxID=1932117 RepID=UPI003F2F7720